MKKNTTITISPNGLTDLYEIWDADANLNTKNCSLSIVLTATDQNPQKSLKR